MHTHAHTYTNNKNKGQEETLGGIYFHGLNGSDGFMGVYLSANS